jgi:uncharacterized protein YecE (DUF72 family)
MEGKGQFFGGTSGLLTPIPKREFPEAFRDKSRLSYYSTLFDTIEINSSFYKIPNAGTLNKWVNEVPNDFKFTFKLWKGITHNKDLTFDPDDVFRFIDIINHLAAKAGCLLIQFPPSLSNAQTGQLKFLLATLKEANDHWHLALEFRHRSWYQENTYDLLTEYGASLVIHDLPASAAPLPESPADFMYLRFHGPEGRYRGSYRDDFLYEYSLYVTEWLQAGKKVYVYFNNTMGDALHNLQTLKTYIDSK